METSEVEGPKKIRKLRIDEIAQILRQFKTLTKTQNYGTMEACGIIAKEWGRSQGTIYCVIQRFRPTVDGAEAYMRANALKLAMRVVRKADVAQSIDILQRSNIGVLAQKTAGEGGGGGFFLSVQSDSCGSVKVGVAQGIPQTFEDLPQPLELSDTPYTEDAARLLDAPQGASRPSSHVADPEPELIEEPKPISQAELNRTPGVPHPYQSTFGKYAGRPREEWSQKAKDAIERTKNRLKEARRHAHLKKNRDIEV